MSQTRITVSIQFATSLVVMGLVAFHGISPAIAYDCSFPGNPNPEGLVNCYADEGLDDNYGNTKTCKDLGGFCKNRVCHCGETVPSLCDYVCSDVGLTCASGSCTSQGWDACRGIRDGGDRKGVISYCDVDTCSALRGQACTSAANACGMTKDGTYDCTPTCSAAKPADSLCPKLPEGWHDAGITCTSTFGWTYDPDYSGSTTVHLYEGATFLGSVTANQSRPDVDNWAKTVGQSPPNRTSSGWSWNIPASLKDGVAHSITAYAINLNAAGNQTDPNKALFGTPKSITCTEAGTGALTSGACGTVSGNATDPQWPSGSVPIAIFDGLAGSGGTQIGTGTANPNFTISIPQFTDGLVHTLYAYSQDAPGSLLWPILGGSAQVSCPPTVSLSATPPTVEFTGASAINWNVSGASSCEATPAGWYNGTLVAGKSVGSGATGPLTSSTTYTLKCNNLAGSQTTGTVTVGVNVPSPTATIVNVTQSNYCDATAPGMRVDWKYESVGLPISQYRVEVLDGSGTVVFDTGIVAKTPDPIVVAPTQDTTLQSASRPSIQSRNLGTLLSNVLKLFMK